MADSKSESWGEGRDGLLRRKSRFKVPRRLSFTWVINPEEILESFEREGGRPLFKFSYQPGTGEFLCAAYPVQHCEMIEQYGAKEFDSYIRGK